MDTDQLTRLPDPASTTSWALGPRLMLRVAGLPVETVDALRCPATLRWAEEVVRAESRSRDRRAALGDTLHRAIGGLEDTSTRQALIRLRREVFNDRLRVDRDLRDITAALPAPARAELDDWLEDRRHLAGLVSRGAVLLALETSHTRAVLRRLAAEPRLRAGLVLASPALEAQLDRFSASPLTDPDKRTRKVERSLLAYLYRTACKTSPFSTFTGVALGRLVDPDVPECAAQQVVGPWTSVVKVNVVALTRLAEAVAADAGRRADLPVSLASGWGRDRDRVRYVRRSVRTGDDSATVTYDSARDQLFFLRRSQVLERTLARFESRPVVSHGELAAWLQDQLHDELGATAADCERYLADLADLGILQVPLLATDVHSADPLRGFQGALRSLDRPWADELASALDGPVRCLDRYPAAGVAQRRDLLGELRSGLQTALDLLGRPDVSLPQTLLYEDVRAGDAAVPFDAQEWDTLVAAPLRALEGVLPAFDLTLRHQLTLHGFFLARYGPGGRCEDVLRLVHEFGEDLYGEYESYVARTPRVDEQGALVPDPNWLALRSVAALDEARRLFADRLTSLAEARPDAAELELDGSLLDDVASLVGDRPSGLAATTHYLQLARRDQDPLVVHNGAFGGLCFPFSRFTHCFPEAPADAVPDLTAELRRATRALQPDGAVLAEVTGGSATSNLNLHAPLTDYEIVGPGEAGTVPEDRRIDLGDLVLEHDPASDRLVLRSRRLAREVLPVYLGYLVPQALPAVPRTLLLLSSCAVFDLDPWAGTARPRQDDGIQHRPRLRIGSLVLSRRSWSLGAGELPLAPAGTPAHEGYLGWQRWRVRHGVPEQVFARVHPTDARTFGGRAKPQFVDFASPMSLTAFEALLTDGSARVVLTERLPESHELHVSSERGRHVAELAVETVTSRSTGSSHPRRAMP